MRSTHTAKVQARGQFSTKEATTKSPQGKMDEASSLLVFKKVESVCVAACVCLIAGLGCKTILAATSFNLMFSVDNSICNGCYLIQFNILCKLF